MKEREDILDVETSKEKKETEFGLFCVLRALVWYKSRSKVPVKVLKESTAVVLE